MEKTPNHMLMTRFLQKLFTPERTHFVITLRHPLGATHFKWKLPQQLKAFQADCGLGLVKHWLAQMRILEEDLRHIDNVSIVMFEFFTKGGYHQANYDVLMASLGLHPQLSVQVEPRTDRKSLREMQELMEKRILRNQGLIIKNGMVKRAQPRSRRRLLGYRGQSVHEHSRTITLHEERWMSWTSALEERIPNYHEHPACKPVMELESEVNRYGYSLVHPSRVRIPECLKDRIIVPSPNHVKPDRS